MDDPERGSKTNSIARIQTPVKSSLGGEKFVTTIGPKYSLEELWLENKSLTGGRT